MEAIIKKNISKNFIENFYKKGKRPSFREIQECYMEVASVENATLEEIKELEDKTFKENQDVFNFDNFNQYQVAYYYVKINFDIRLNVITNGYYIKFKRQLEKEYKPLQEEYLYNWLSHKHIKFKKTDLSAIIMAQAQEYDEILNYFKYIAKYKTEKKNVIEDFLACVKLKNESLRDFFVLMFKKHLVRAIRQIIDHKENRYVFCINGPQLIGKSRFIKHLIPFDSGRYYSEERIEPSKDARISFVSTLIYNIEEVEDNTPKENAHLKAMISSLFINVRRPYARQAESLVRRCTFFASTNKLEFLSDLENTRWLPFVIKYIDFKKYSEEIKTDDIWKQAYELFENKDFNCELTPQECETQKKMLEDTFVKQSIELECIHSLYRIPTEEELKLKKAKFVVNTNIFNKIQELAPQSYRISQYNISRAMTKLGFEQHRTNQFRGFYVIEKNSMDADELNLKNIQGKTCPF